jgi:hypothetical protein
MRRVILITESIESRIAAFRLKDLRAGSFQRSHLLILSRENSLSLARMDRLPPFWRRNRNNGPWASQFDVLIEGFTGRLRPRARGARCDPGDWT